MFHLDWQGLIGHYGYGAIALVLCLESMGLPLPGESLLIAAAIYALTSGDLSIQWIVLAAAVGTIVGDNLGYGIGRWVGPRVVARYGPKIGLLPDRQKLGQFLFRQHGGKVVFFGRFVVFLRTFAAVLAGANGMPWPRFILWNALGGATWSALYGFVPYLLGDQFRRLEGPVGIVIGVVAASVVVTTVWVVRRDEKRLLAQARADLAAEDAN